MFKPAVICRDERRKHPSHHQHISCAERAHARGPIIDPTFQRSFYLYIHLHSKSTIWHSRAPPPCACVCWGDGRVRSRVPARSALVPARAGVSCRAALHCHQEFKNIYTLKKTENRAAREVKSSGSSCVIRQIWLKSDVMSFDWSPPSCPPSAPHIRGSGPHQTEVWRGSNTPREPVRPAVRALRTQTPEWSAPRAGTAGGGVSVLLTFSLLHSGGWWEEQSQEEGGWRARETRESSKVIYGRWFLRLH